MEHNPPPNRKESYKFYAKLSWNNGYELTVPCKVFLPQKISERPQVYIYPDAKQFSTLPGTEKCLLYASIGDPIEMEIIGERTHISGGRMRRWEPGLEEGYLKVYPSKLVIIQHLNTSRRESEETTLLFKLTPSLLLSPSDIHEYHFDGEAHLTRGERFHFKLEEEFELEFLNHYKWINSGDRETLTFPELVAIAKLTHQAKEDEVQRYLSLIDDFLLLVSFAEGRRCTTPEYTLQLPNKIIETYRLDRLIPNNSSKHSVNDFLIDFSDFRNFIDITWESLKGSSQYRLVKTALEVITNDAPRTIESEYMSLYSSIETIILAYRLDNNLEHILRDPNQHHSFIKDLREFIRSHEHFQNNKEGRSLIYQNIPVFLRLPLKQAFKEFIKAKGLDLDDLWPFYDDNSGCSLTKIRNRLMHGYGLDEPFMDSYLSALYCLQYYAKRLLLASISWNFQKSRLFRMPDSEVKKWKDAKADLDQWD